MTKLFKKVLIFSLFVFACFMLVGCEESATDYDHTIVFYSTQGDSLQQVTQNAINAFERICCDVEVVCTCDSTLHVAITVSDEVFI